MLSNDMMRNQLITRRAFIFAAGASTLLSTLAGRLFYMQVIKSGEYSTLSDQNRINLITLHPVRGAILDCNGKLLAHNRSAFNVMLDKHETDNYKNSLHNLFKILNSDNKTQELVFARIKKLGLQFPLMIMHDISWRDVALIEEDLANLSGIYVEMGQLRFYPYAQAAAHVIGYSGILNENEKLELGLHNIGYFNVGKTGMEKFYESDLRGTFGIKKMEVNAHGAHVRELSTQQSSPGDQILSNIDADLQTYVYKLLPSTGASAIVIRVDNGKVLVSASSKSFDPNQFTDGISYEHWDDINNDPYKPLINRVTQSNYPPGSIFKIITALAALENGLDPNIKVRCVGGVSALGNEYFRCWHKTGHGELDMHDAIQHSCNAYIYHIVKTIGGEKILNIARQLGFGTPTGIDLPSEASGFVPSKTWKLRRFSSNWTLADSLNISIGQGSLLVTPIQLATLSAIIANEGTAHTPKIVGLGDVKNTGIDKKHFQFLKRAMWNAVNTPGGTAYAQRILDPNWSMSGKTGTAQVQSKHGDIDLSSSDVGFWHRNHAIFIGFAPSDKPKYAFAVFVEHGGGGGGIAAPIAHDIVMELSRRAY